MRVRIDDDGAGTLTVAGARYLLIRPETLVALQRAAESALGSTAADCLVAGGRAGLPPHPWRPPLARHAHLRPARARDRVGVRRRRRAAVSVRGAPGVSGILPPLTIGPDHESQRQGFWVKVDKGRFKPLTDWLKSD